MPKRRENLSIASAKWLSELAEAYRAVDRYFTRRLRWWLCKKHRVPGRGTARDPDEYLYNELGLVRLVTRTRRLPWAKA
jgi:RNA-directed DNA polymerase